MLPAGDYLPELERLIALKNYFVIHAPRQVGKTTAMLTLDQGIAQMSNVIQEILNNKNEKFDQKTANAIPKT